MNVEYDEDFNGKRMIYRGYDDIEVVTLSVSVQCPYCGNEQSEIDKDMCGETYDIECDYCEQIYEMYFDVD